MTGTCGTCGRDAAATAENEGYSSCCNDRIEYGLEAEETRQRVAFEERVTALIEWGCSEYEARIRATGELGYSVSEYGAVES